MRRIQHGNLPGTFADVHAAKLASLMPIIAAERRIPTSSMVADLMGFCS
jgi:hypothetical protein